MALNREQKRMLQKRGELNEDGTQAATRRQPPSGGRPPGGAEERTGVRQFVREVRSELRKVAWPSREEVINYSIVVLATVIFVTALIGVLDYGLGEALLKLFER